MRVRLLLDATASPHGRAPAPLDAHPNVEVRLFNPFGRQGALGRSVDFQRLNRRMHNKSMTADGTIVGGRNSAIVFLRDAHVAFVDLDAGGGKVA